MKLEIGDCVTMEFDMAMFQETAQLVPVHVYARDGERYEMLELNKTIIRSIKTFGKNGNINVALLTIYRASKFRYIVSPGALIITKERGRYALQ